MARIPLRHEDNPDSDPEIMAALERVESSGFPTLNVFRALANKPEALDGFMSLVMSIYNTGTGAGHSSITAKETELAYTTATVANNCHYWIPTHIMLGRSVGITEEQLSHLGDEPLPDGLYAPSEAAIVRYARQSTLHLKVDDAMYAELAKFFTTRQIIDICLVVGQSNLVNRFHATFLTDVDPATLSIVREPGTTPIALPIY